MSEHVVPRKVYYAIFASLMVLTLVTVAVAFVDLGMLSTPLALGIACVKASLVILYFMHVRYSERLNGVIVGMSALFLFVLLAITLSDYVSRGWLPYPGK
jgi:cytochrome c oxidase subunit 4